MHRMIIILFKYLSESMNNSNIFFNAVTSLPNYLSYPHTIRPVLGWDLLSNTIIILPYVKWMSLLNRWESAEVLLYAIISLIQHHSL